METNKQNKTGRITATTILVICLVGFGLLLAACNQGTNLVNTEQILPTVEDESALSDVTAALPTNASETVIEATETPSADITTTRTKAEIVAQDIAQSGGQFTASFSNCLEILENEPSCVVIRTGIQVSRPEWEALFSQAEFYLVKYDLDRGETVQGRQGNLLVVEQDGQRLSLFPDQMFEQLLEMNHIVVTDQNQEQVARALVLTRLPDYLENDIIFSNWRESEWPSIYDIPFNFAIDVWTEINGLKLEWVFMFHEQKLLAAEGFIVDDGVGDYVDSEVSTPSREILTYYRSQP